MDDAASVLAVKAVSYSEAYRAYRKALRELDTKMLEASTHPYPTCETLSRKHRENLDRLAKQEAQALKRLARAARMFAKEG